MYYYMHRYNVEALHTKLLREEELERAAMAQQQNSDINSTMVRLATQVAAAQQAIHVLQQQKHLIQAVEQQQQHPHQYDSDMLVQHVVINIDRTLQKINELHSLHLEKKRLAARYGGGALPPEGESQKRHLDKQIQQGYSQLSRNIQFANESIGCFNKSPAAHVPHLLRIVAFKRHQLNTQLEALKSSQSKSMGGTAPPTRSTQGGGSSGHATGGSSSAEVSSSTQTNSNHQQIAPPRQGTNSRVKEMLMARVAGSNEEKQMRETAKELLVKKTKAPADSSTNLSTTKKN